TALRPGRTYYWSVQALDNSFAGGPFAAEASFTVPAAAELLLSAADAVPFEIQLRATPNSRWQFEMSRDLKTWSAYPAPGILSEAGTNGSCRIQIAPTGVNQFFRARQQGN